MQQRERGEISPGRERISPQEIIRRAEKYLSFVSPYAQVTGLRIERGEEEKEGLPVVVDTEGDSFVRWDSSIGSKRLRASFTFPERESAEWLKENEGEIRGNFEEKEGIYWRRDGEVLRISRVLPKEVEDWIRKATEEAQGRREAAVALAYLKITLRGTRVELALSPKTPRWEKIEGDVFQVENTQIQIHLPQGDVWLKGEAPGDPQVTFIAPVRGLENLPSARLRIHSFLKKGRIVLEMERVGFFLDRNKRKRTYLLSLMREEVLLGETPKSFRLKWSELVGYPVLWPAEIRE